MSTYNEDIKFKITNIKTERTPNGFTTFEFITVEDSLVEDVMSIKLPNPLASDKRQVKGFMMGKYYTLLNNMIRDEIIRVGDTI